VSAKRTFFRGKISRVATGRLATVKKNCSSYRIKYLAEYKTRKIPINSLMVVVGLYKILLRSVPYNYLRKSNMVRYDIHISEARLGLVKNT
jgi:hypothetical protein